MQPAARLAAIIELLTEIEAEMTARKAPADVLVANYFRARRYAGSKDRRAVSDRIYAILRNRGLYGWALEQAGQGISARALLIAHLVRREPEQLALFGGDDRFAPTAVDTQEAKVIARLQDINWDTAPDAVVAGVPSWSEEGLRARFGDEFAHAAQALLGKAPLDVRINPLKAKGLGFDKILKKDYQLFDKLKFSENSYRASSSVNLLANAAYKQGLIEIQDEAAQTASMLVGAEAGQQVVDLCAGAGGKSLAMAATMENRGQIHAFDISKKRLTEFGKRMQRAGARNIQIAQLPHEDKARQERLATLANQAHRVVLDVPCSGTGTWRRSPDQRWRFDAAALDALTAVQDALLREGAAMVRPGGRLVYMTCSLLPQENEDRVAAFLESAGAAMWQTVDYRSIWPESTAPNLPDTLSSNPAFLQLAPHSHGTDGFFIAVLQRVG